MSFLISNVTVVQELSLFAVVATAIGSYLYFFVNASARQKKLDDRQKLQAQDSAQSFDAWSDHQPLFWRQSMGFLGQSSDLFYISAFTSELLRARIHAQPALAAETKMCVSRSAQDTEKLIHPLIKKIESRLRRAELRPRPRLISDRQTTPFPLFSSIRPDIELSTCVLNFLDACIDLSASCDTQVNFHFQADNDGVCISAVWKKNHLIADASAQIELLDQMRLTMSGDQVRWDYQLFECPKDLEALPELNDEFSASA